VPSLKCCLSCLLKNKLRRSQQKAETFLANTSDLETQQKVKKPCIMKRYEIELNFDASCQQILGLESEILWEARSTPTLIIIYFLVFLLLSCLTDGLN
jgi:hypothetical protein